MDAIANKILQKVKAVQDDTMHWYVIPVGKLYEFFEDMENDNIVDTSIFGEKWGKYSIGRNVNNVQLWAEI